MSFAIWFSALDCVEEGLLQEVGGNGRMRTMLFEDEGEAEEQARMEEFAERERMPIAFFAIPYPTSGEWRAEWYAHRDRVHSRGVLGLKSAFRGSSLTRGG